MVNYSIFSKSYLTEIANVKMIPSQLFIYDWSDELTNVGSLALNCICAISDTLDRCWLIFICENILRDIQTLQN